MLSVCLQVDYSYRKDIVIGLLKIHQILSGGERKGVKLSTIFNFQYDFTLIAVTEKEYNVEKQIEQRIFNA